MSKTPDKSSLTMIAIIGFVAVLVFSPGKVDNANNNYDNRQMPTHCTSAGGCAPGETPTRPTYRNCEATGTCPDIGDVNVFD